MLQNNNNTQLEKAHLTKWKEHTMHIAFIIFWLWPRIEKGDIIVIKVIGTALNKPYIICPI